MTNLLTHPTAQTSSPAAVDGVTFYSDPVVELAAVASGNYVAELSHLAVLDFSGADATSFLQGQLSCDVEEAARSGVSTFGSYCTPKGRMLASFLLVPDAGNWRMILSASIAQSIQKRLSMYVLRSRVKIASVSQAFALFGVGGADALAVLGALTNDLTQQPHQVKTGKAPDDVDLTIVNLPGRRWLLMMPVAGAQSVWRSLAARLTAVSVPAWELAEIRNGIALITAKTQEQFIPQMMNLELIGGVNFKKGCYPGQEIVARTQYLGKLKRRLYLAHADCEAFPGDELFSEDVQGQSNGMVVNAAPAPEGGCDLLAVVQAESAAHSRVHLRAADGAILQFLQLPYSVP